MAPTFAHNHVDPPTNVRVEVENDDDWLIQWDDDQLGTVIANYTARYSVLGEDESVLYSVTTDRISDRSHTIPARNIVAGRAFKMEVAGRTTSGADTEASPWSDAVYFGSHPTPTVVATSVLGSSDIRVGWQPTARVSRGGSAVSWEVTALVQGGDNPPEPVQKTVTDTGSTDESNAGETTLKVDQSFGHWTVTVRAVNAAGPGLAGETTVNVNADRIELALAPSTIFEQEAMLDFTITATLKLDAGSGDLGNTEPLILRIDVDGGSTATRGSEATDDYDIPAENLPV